MAVQASLNPTYEVDATGELRDTEIMGIIIYAKVEPERGNMLLSIARFPEGHSAIL